LLIKKTGVAAGFAGGEQSSLMRAKVILFSRVCFRAGE
jgi:hypothetical protein